MTTDPRSLAIQTARQQLGLSPLYLDTETTGTDRSSEIVEICIIDNEGNSLFQSLVKPTTSIPAQTTQIHGITNEMAKTAPPWYKIWPEVEAILTGRPLGIYNKDFDLRLIQQTHAKFRIPWRPAQTGKPFCIMKLYAQYYGEWDAMRGSYRWQSLEAAGKQLRIPLQNSHRAMDDALLAREVLLAMAKTDIKD
jgi:DNA polymerase III subunit epsilon